MKTKRVFPNGCTINNIRIGDGKRSGFIYASLRHPDGSILISATLDYINEQLIGAELVDVDKFDDAVKGATYGITH